MQTQLLDAQLVSKSFNGLSAVNQASVSLLPGDIYALVGENGAGKTTLLKILVGLHSADSGSVEICGQDINIHDIEAKKHFGYVPDDPVLYEFLTGYEFISMTGALRGMTGNTLTSRVAEVSSIFPISDILGQPMSSYSRGNRQKTAILSAIMSQPDVLIIDEPIVGLDPHSIGILGKLFISYVRAGRAILFVTHIMQFAVEYATRYGVMAKGRIIKENLIHKGMSADNLMLDL